MKCSALFAMSLVCVSQAVLSAGEMVPVKGSHVYPSFTLGVPYVDEGCKGLAIPLTGTSYGNVSHLGKFSESADVTFCLETGSSYGTATWTAANGDQLFAHFTGQDQLRGEGDSFVIADYVTIIDGGSGRFEGASGTIYTEQFRPDPQDGTGGAINTLLSGSEMSSVGSSNSAHAVPEPTSLTLAFGAAWGLATFVRRRTRGR